jgi:hypothetical protein
LNATPEHTDTLKEYDCPISIKISKREKTHRVWHRLRTSESKQLLNTATQEFNSPVTTKMIAFKYSCNVLHHQNPLTIPCGRRPRQWNILLNLGHHKKLGKATTLKKHTLSLNTKQIHAPQKINPKKKKKHLHNFWRPRTKSNHQSSVSKEPKFKKSSTA